MISIPALPVTFYERFEDRSDFKGLQSRSLQHIPQRGDVVCMGEDTFKVHEVAWIIPWENPGSNMNIQVEIYLQRV